MRDGGRVGAIVLAGGRSSRFGSDKLEARIDGRSLLDHAVAAVQMVATDVVVCVRPGAQPTVPDGVIVAHDATSFDGPLAGVVTGLAALPAAVDRLVVVGGDMPSMASAVLHRLLEMVGDGADAACLADPDGQPRPLPSAYRRAAADGEVMALLASGERRLRALPAALGASVVPSSAWMALDPIGGTLRDIDTPADLTHGSDAAAGRRRPDGGCRQG